MKYVLIVILMVILSCKKEKTIQLPEISTSEITEINDVSAAYLFYDETKKDSVELNRKNLISTTHWLINVDKRLKLKQVIPHIIFLQNKKLNSSHKNINAKNYFTCHDTSNNNLGFIDFTYVFYHNESSENYFSKTSNPTKNTQFNMTFYASEGIEITSFTDDFIQKKTNKTNLVEDVKLLLHTNKNKADIVLSFNSQISFQDYITYKSILQNLKDITTVKHEFILN